jgi:hypothetical protein
MKLAARLILDLAFNLAFTVLLLCALMYRATEKAIDKSFVVRLY